MPEVTISLERDGEHYRVFANLHGFYLGGSDIERVFGSIIPLAQHCYWRNYQECALPEMELDHKQLLETNALTISFVFVENLRKPNILANGEWWKSPQGTSFFVPSENDTIDTKILDKIHKDMEDE